MSSAAFLLVVILSLFGVSAGADAQCSELVVPPLLIGCWKLMERERDPEKVVSVLMQYAEAGYTTFDTADIYGPSERVLGLFRSRYAEKYGAEEAAAKLRFFTKYVTGDTTKENAEAVNAASLQALGVDALDLVQFHWWDFESSASFLTAANELVALQLAGKIKHIGVTNFDVPHLSRLIEAKVPVKVNQVQYSLFDRRPEHGMLAYCQANGCQLATYGTVAGGWLSDKYLGKQQHEARASQASQQMYQSALQDWSGGSWVMYQELLQELRRIGDKHGADKTQTISIANVATRYVIQMLESTCGGGVIKGVRDSSHLQDVSALQSFVLDDEDFVQIRRVLAKGTDLPGDCYGKERGYAS